MKHDDTIRYAVVIPAYRPPASLVDLVRDLTEKAIPAIVIVDDGSGPGYEDVFSRAAAFPNVHLVRHAVNLGKGAALKTGMNFALCAFPDLAGVVTADADGQHHADDIEQIAGALLAQPGCLVLGGRSFDGDVPWRSRFGNTVTRTIVHALLGRKLMDTQTGLRGVPAGLLPRLLRLQSSGYEFELEMLILAGQLSVPVVEEPVRTIYYPGNKTSHFNPVIDSIKIYLVLLRFGSVSLLTALLDNLIFYFAYSHFGNVLVAQVLGRLCAVEFNYSMVRSSVFYSAERHKTVLPKYLALVLASTAASYAGIRFLAARLRIDPVPAKFMVEAVLFFVNFVVQRALIFKPPGPLRRRPRAAPAWRLPALVVLVFLGLVGLEIYGLRAGHLLSQDIWDPLGIHRFARYTGLYLALVVPLLVLVPWTLAGFACALLIVLTAISVGPQAVLGAAFFLVSSCALGAKLLGRTKDDSLETHLCATLLGTGVYIFLMTFLARVPVNYAVFWGLLLAIPVALDWRGVKGRFAYWGDLLRSAELRSWSQRAALAFLIFILAMHWLVVLKPETGTDGLVMHLGIPANLAAHHAMTFAPDRFLWSVMPMGADFAYAIVYLFGGEYAAHLLNFAMLLLVEALLYCAVRRWVSSSTGFLLLALFAATPLVQFVTGSLFVENLLAAMILGMITAIWRFSETGEKKFLYAAMALGGTALSTKYAALAFLAVALPVVFVEARRHRKLLGPRPLASCALAVVLLLVTGLPMYVIAWHKTGNPLYPFFNVKIHSPLLDPTWNFQDDRFSKPVAWTTPFDLTFHTHESYEGQDGSLGFQYLVMVPLGLLSLLAVRQRRVWIAAIVALGALFLLLRLQPNARYLYAALPLLFVPFAALLGWLNANRRWVGRLLVTYVVLCTALDAYFLPSSSWYHKDFYWQSPLSRAARSRYLRKYAPLRQLLMDFEKAHPHAAVFFANDNDLADVTGEVYQNSWHQYPVVCQLQRALDLKDMVRLFQKWKVRYFVARKLAVGERLDPVNLRKFMAACTLPETQVGDFYLARLDPACEDERTLAARAPSRPLIVVKPGVYDDFDPAILFRGDWTQTDAFEGPAEHTISYCDIPGAEASLLFEGASLTYVFTKAPNRGLAAITIDGIGKGTIDLYSPKIEWHSKVKFSGLGAGKHLAVIRVAGQSTVPSSGRFVDLDSFVVE